MKAWKPWGDHPVIVSLTALAALAAIVTVIVQRPWAATPPQPSPGIIDTSTSPATSTVSGKILPRDGEAREKALQIALPSAQHRDLARFVGRWSVKGETLTADGKRHLSFNGIATGKWIHDFRFVAQHADISLEGDAISATTVIGYDTDRRHYCMFSADSTGTGMEIMTGKMLNSNTWSFTDPTDPPSDAIFETRIAFAGDNNYTSETALVRGQKRQTLFRTMYRRIPN